MTPTRHESNGTPFRSWKLLALLVVPLLVLMFAHSASANSLSQFKVVVGQVVLSEDACGTNVPFPTSSCTVDIVKPSALATVRQGDLFCATTGFSGYSPTNTDVTLNAAAVLWDAIIPNSISSFNARDDVTAIVKPVGDAALPGLVTFTITENPTFSYDGCVLKVIWDDPATTQNSILIFWGAQTTTGDTFVINFAPLSAAAFALPMEFSLGISFGFQPSSQFSQVDVNSVRLTTSAGGQDDGAGANGALITVGGTGDTAANPPPFAPPVTASNPDDELYDLRPFTSVGATSMTIFTLNPSNDDNIFLANLFLRNVRVVTEAEGRMTGGGSVIDAAVGRVTHGFELHCDETDLPNNLEVNWGKGNNFHLETLTSASCTDDASIDPGQPAAAFDTYEGSGDGRCNGQPASIEFRLTDAGEPGVNDEAEFSISGACTLNVGGTLDRGNHQAHPNS